jgi:hypothetical protein
MRRGKASQPEIAVAAAHKKFFCQVTEVFPVFLSIGTAA